MQIGERIRQARERKRLTQEQLGEAVGVSDAAVSQWKTGGIQPVQGFEIQARSGEAALQGYRNRGILKCSGAAD